MSLPRAEVVLDRVARPRGDMIDTTGAGVAWEGDRGGETGECGREDARSSRVDSVAPGRCAHACGISCKSALLCRMERENMKRTTIALADTMPLSRSPPGRSNGMTRGVGRRDACTRPGPATGIAGTVGVIGVAATMATVGLDPSGVAAASALGRGCSGLAAMAVLVGGAGFLRDAGIGSDPVFPPAGSGRLSR